MSEYKCENHKLNIVCLGCVKAIMRREKKLLEFVKSLAWIERYNDKEIKEFNDLGFYLEAKEARDLLKEIGEL